MFLHHDTEIRIYRLHRHKLHCERKAKRLVPEASDAIPNKIIVAFRA